MIILLRIWFLLVLVAMSVVTVWASLQGALWHMPAAVVTHPWFIATLFDTYFAFTVFFFWVAYKERSILKSAFWLVGIYLLGNFVIATYCLIQLFKVKASDPLRKVLLRDSN